MKNNIPQGYKATALGIIPQEWEVTHLEDLCHNQGDYGINAPATDFSNELPTYLRITDIDDDGKFIIANKASVNNPNSRSYHLKDGDIVFARTGATVGKTYLYNREDGDLVFAGFLIRFSPDQQKITPYYLKAYTNTSAYWKWVKITSQRSGQPGINATEYCSLQIPVPPLAEQRKIADVLGVWDEAIEKQARLIEKLALRKRALMQRLLSAKLRLPGFSEPWKTLHIADFAFEINSRNKSNSPYEVLSCTKYEGLVSSLKYFGKQIYSDDLSTYKIVPKNRFAYATNHIEEGSIGYQSKYDQALISPMYTVFGTNPSLINDAFLYKLLKTQKLIYLYKSRMEGSIDRRGGLRWNDFASIKIALPSIEEQTAIAEVLTAADREIELAKEKLERLRRQKRGLMQQLLTGKKRI